MLYLNIQGLKGKLPVLKSFSLHESNLKFICLSEYWLNQSEAVATFPSNFYCSAVFSRTDHIRGGTNVRAQLTLYLI